MANEIIPLEKGKTMKDLFPNGVPEKSIIDKTIPAVGATYCEITNISRNSIIIEPNVPVIQNKEQKHPDILGIYKGVRDKKIIDYLSRTDIAQKILTTPESYKRLKDCAQKLELDLYKNYFLMFDECDKIIQDSDYRKTITFPFEDFFLYDKQCLISATPLTPRIKALRDYRQIKIIPQYEYKKDISLVITNNILEVLKLILTDKVKNPIAIFLNSAELILGIIKKLEIEKESNVFCGDDAYKKIDNKDIHVSKVFDGLNRYNFFTSRFYSAVDLDCEEMPHILMITDCRNKKQTIIDPATHAIQICGRFRNGIRKITHITNYDYFINVKPENELFKYLKEQRHTYKIIKEVLEPTLTSQAGKDLVQEIKEKLTICKFLREDNEFDAFAVENYLNNEKVQAYYKSPEQIEKAYKKTKFFNVTIKPAMFDKPMADITDKKAITKEQREINFERLKKLLPDKGKTFVFDCNPFFGEMSEADKIREADPLTYEYYMIFGDALIQIDGFNKKKMEDRISDYKERQSKIPVIYSILNAFKVNEKYTDKEIKEALEKINIKYNVNLKPSASTLRLYFELSPRTTITRNGERDKGYKILSQTEFSIK